MEENRQILISSRRREFELRLNAIQMNQKCPVPACFKQTLLSRWSDPRGSCVFKQNRLKTCLRPKTDQTSARPEKLSQRHIHTFANLFMLSSDPLSILCNEWSLANANSLSLFQMNINMRNKERERGFLVQFRVISHFPICSTFSAWGPVACFRVVRS